MALLQEYQDAEDIAKRCDYTINPTDVIDKTQSMTLLEPLRVASCDRVYSNIR